MKLLPAVITNDQVAISAVADETPGAEQYTIVFSAEGLVDAFDQGVLDDLTVKFSEVAAKHFDRLTPDERVVYFDTELDEVLDEAAAKKKYEDAGVAIPIGKDVLVPVKEEPPVEEPPIDATGEGLALPPEKA